MRNLLVLFLSVFVFLCSLCVEISVIQSQRLLLLLYFHKLSYYDIYYMINNRQYLLQTSCSNSKHLTSLTLYQSHGMLKAKNSIQLIYVDVSMYYGTYRLFFSQKAIVLSTFNFWRMHGIAWKRNGKGMAYHFLSA